MVYLGAMTKLCLLKAAMPVADQTGQLRKCRWLLAVLVD